MIRSILIMKPSGIIYYTQEFFKPFPKATSVGQLMVAMLNAFSQALNNITPFYMEFRGMALSICLRDKKLAVLVFHDISLSPASGRFLSFKLMDAFFQIFPTIPDRISTDFVQRRVNAMINTVLLGTQRDLLINLTWSPGIEKAFLIQVNHSLSSLSPLYPTNSHPIQSSFRHLIITATRIMTLCDPDELVGEIVFETPRDRIFFTQIAPDIYLVSVVCRSAIQSLVRSVLDQAVRQLTLFLGPFLV
ncbi:hypothetical protein BLNAU_15801 [Blattamonas nauphoetae]|uniref:Uncharacterized protein n=1 Tax=Blattamonas nauphoetae TaxID=2049346 RepID=A0ABQ9XD55_9EUKA|nr:hypothetical protein BLNAU_15801 [Blattamonas nauphoetae]